MPVQQKTFSKIQNLELSLDDSNNTDNDVKRAVDIMSNCGALENCREQALGYLNGAKKTIAKYPENNARTMLEELLEYMVTRGH